MPQLLGPCAQDLAKKIDQSMRETMREKMAAMMGGGRAATGLGGRPLPPELAAMLGGLAGGNAPGENLPPQGGLVADTGAGQIDLAALLRGMVQTRGR